jgi:hypothetical protein
MLGLRTGVCPPGLLAGCLPGGTFGHDWLGRMGGPDVSGPARGEAAPRGSSGNRRAAAYAAKAICFGLRNLLDPAFQFEERAILGYHSISDSADPAAVGPKAFEDHLHYLAGRGHTVVTLATLVDWKRGKARLARKAVALTFDDGYQDFLTAALPILERHNTPVALFALGDPETVRMMPGHHDRLSVQRAGSWHRSSLGDARLSLRHPS